MKSSTHPTQAHKNPDLSVVTANSINAGHRELAKYAWTFAYSVLWNSTVFSSKEIQHCQERIAQIIRLAKSPRLGFKIFCQRIILAKCSPDADLHSPITLPSLWLDKDVTSGYNRTRLEYIQIKRLRESLPNYMLELKALAEAVLEFSEESSQRNYRYWRNFFIDKQSPDLLQLFQVYVSNFHFSN